MPSPWAMRWAALGQGSLRPYFTSSSLVSMVLQRFVMGVVQPQRLLSNESSPYKRHNGPTARAIHRILQGRGCKKNKARILRMYYSKQLLLFSTRHALCRPSQMLLLQWPPNSEHPAVNLVKPLPLVEGATLQQGLGNQLSELPFIILEILLGGSVRLPQLVCLGIQHPLAPSCAHGKQN